MASFGENLRREREIRGISLRDISDATKISVRFLQALEQDRMEILPGGIFRRAFVRQYARQIGLDPERTVLDFDSAHREDESTVPVVPPLHSPWPVRGVLAVSAGIALLAATLVVRLVQDRKQDPPALASTAAPTTTLWSSDRVYPPPSPPSPQAATETDGLVLTLSARQACWVAARVDGENTVGKVLAVGETETIEAAREIVLSVGNAGGLQFSVNNRPGLPLGRSGEVRRNIVITRQSLPSLVQEASLKTPRS